MLEFAREQWLWVFTLLAVFYVAWWIARRYARKRVTHAAVWHRVAKRMLPPAWKRILRTVLTLLVATLLLSAVALFAAGVQRPQSEHPAPLLVVIVLDNSASMRAQAGEDTRRELAQTRAAELLAALGENDRALLAWFKDGAPLLGPWMRRNGEPGSAPPTDFARQDLRALDDAVGSLAPPPDMPTVPAPRKLVIWLGDTPPELPGRPEASGRIAAFHPTMRLGDVPVVVETFGGKSANNAIVSAHYTPPAPGERHGGVVEAETLDGSDATFLLQGGAEVGKRIELPDSVSGRIVVSSGAGDALSEDDDVSFALYESAIKRVTLCYPAEDGEPNDRIIAVLNLLLPGREVVTTPVPGAAVDCDLLVADRVLPQTYHASALLLFGVAGEYGRTGAPIRVLPNIRARPEGIDVGFEVPNLAFVEAEEAVPLVDSALTPLERDVDGHVLVGVTRGDTEVLYCGFVPHKSTLFVGSEGPLLLLRWIDAIQKREPPPVPPLVAAGEQVQLRLPGTSVVQPAAGGSWPGSYTAAGATITPSADSTAMWTVPSEPGTWEVVHEGRVIGRTQILWTNPEEQWVPFTETSAIDPSAFSPPEREADWRDLLPALLLWIALGLATLEWALWLIGVLE